MANGNGNGGFLRHPLTVGILTGLLLGAVAAIGGGYVGAKVGITELKGEISTLATEVQNVKANGADTRDEVRRLRDRVDMLHSGRNGK